MAATVLGKRNRNSTHTEASSANTRSRKRVHVLEDDFDFGGASIVSVLDDAVFNKTHPASALKSRPDEHRSRDPTPTTTFLQDEAENTETDLIAPATPRHRDALLKVTPITPRHRITIGGRPLTPRTPRTPSTSANATRTVYSEARKLFTRGSTTGEIIGRYKERLELSTFISARVEAHSGGCLYVSGPPGTGKSALATAVCQQIRDPEAVQYIYINCMSIKSATDIYSLAANEIGAAESAVDNAEAFLRNLFLRRKSKTSYLVLLDEIDSLLNFDVGILYNLFEWAFAPHSNLILIGIANALDLTDRFLPRLKARNLKPQLLPFLPYTALEIASVLTARCRSLLPTDSTATADFLPVLHPTAIQLISKKVASQSGDLRKAFDIAQRVIDLVETETKQNLAKEVAADQQSLESSPVKSPLSDNLNLSSPRKSTSSPIKHRKIATAISTISSRYTVETAPRATLAHVVRVTSAAFGNGILQRLKSLNLQQKAVLCALVALERRNRQLNSLSPPQTPEKTPFKQANQAAPTVRALGEAYATLCKRDNILHALSSTEFRDVLAGLETSSLVAAADGKGGSLTITATPAKRGRATFGAGNGDERRFSACVSANDLEAAVDGVGASILKGILYGDVIE